MGGKIVIEGGQHCVMADERAVADSNAALILETAATVDKDVFPYRNIFSAVGIKRRKQAKGSVHRFTGESGEQRPNLLRLMIGAVELAGYLQGLLAYFVHIFVDR